MFAGIAREGRVEAARDAVPAHHLAPVLSEVIERREHDLRREGERGDHSPGGERAVVRAVRDGARVVVVEAPRDAFDPARGRAGAVARRDAPAILAVADELLRITNRILLLHVAGAAAVLEVINASRAHEVILNAAKVYPDVGELVNEERPGVEEFNAVKFLPAIGLRPGFVTLAGQPVCR